MTELETRLTEIVEKGQEKEIIPFLQQLTQEERASLIPCLSRMEGSVTQKETLSIYAETMLTATKRN